VTRQPDGWTITLTPRARAQCNSLEPALKDELIAFATALSEKPAEYLHRSTLPELAGFEVAEYDSRVVHGLRVTLCFFGLDQEPPTLSLVQLVQRMFDSEPDE